MHHFRFSQRTVAAVLGVLAVAYTVQAYLIPEFAGVEVPVQPGTLPRGLGLVLIALCVALFFQKPPAEPAATAASPKSEPAKAGGSSEAGGLRAATSSTEPGEPASARTDQTDQTGSPTLGRFSDVRLEVAALLVTICLYVALFVPLGFVLSTTLFITGTAWYLGFSRHWVNVTVGLSVALSLYLGMSEGLDVTLPTGLLPF